MGKRPKIVPKSGVESKKRDVRFGAGSSDGERICWQFGSMDREGPFACPDETAEDWHEILEKLKGFDTQTWSEIKQCEQHHAVQVERMSDEARDRLSRITREDEAEGLFSLRLTGRKRLWGIRDRHVFKVFWWDPEHRVCPCTRD